MYKEKFEKLEREVESKVKEAKEQAKNEVLSEVDRDLERIREEIKAKVEKEINEAYFKEHQKVLDDLQKQLDEAHEKSKRFENLEKALADVFIMPAMKLIESLSREHVKEEVAKVLPELKKTVESSLEFGHVEAHTLNLDASELTVNLSHSEKPVDLTTENVPGRIMYTAINNMPKEGFTEKEICETMKKLYGWDIPHGNLAPQLSGNLVRLGLIYRVPSTKPQRYAVPQKRKINVVKMP